MTIWGIDISNHQPTADLSAAKAAGCSFVFVKGTEGGTYRDPFFAGFYAQAKALGMPLGVYHFARPGNGRTGAQEAQFFLATLAGRLGELPPVLDLEDTKLSPAATVAWALDFLRTVQAATGVRPMLYTYTGFANANLSNGAGLEAFPLWLANYRSTTTPAPPAPSPWSSWQVWQHTSSAKVPGIPGNCDRNVTELSLSQLCALGNAGGTDSGSSIPAVFTKPPVKPTPAPTSKGLNVQIIDLRNAGRTLVKGPGVKPMQRLLGVTPDGLGGGDTRTALGAAQVRIFGKADYIFGPKTAEALLSGK